MMQHRTSCGRFFRRSEPEFAEEAISGQVGYAGDLKTPARPAKLKEFEGI